MNKVILTVRDFEAWKVEVSIEMLTQQQESYRDMISKELLTDLPCLLAVMLKLTSRLVRCGS